MTIMSLVIRESNPQFRLPKWEDVVRLQQRVGKRLLFKMLCCRPTSSNTVKELQR